MRDEPLDLVQAKQIARFIIDEGTYVVSKHVSHRMKERGIDQIDCINVIRGGYCSAAETEGSRWRYRFETQRLVTIIEFLDENSLVVVMSWRKE